MVYPGQIPQKRSKLNNQGKRAGRKAFLLAVVVFLAYTGLVFFLGWLLGGSEAGNMETASSTWAVSQPSEPVFIATNVKAGDRLWTIAREAYPSGKYDTRYIVYEIKKLNPHLDGDFIYAGQWVDIPILD